MRDDVLISINNGMNPVKLKQDLHITNGHKWTPLTYSSPAAKFSLAADGAHDIVSWNGSYTNTFHFQLADYTSPSVYEVVISGSSLDYYFFILGDTLSGQNQAGHGNSITIYKVGIKKVFRQWSGLPNRFQS